MVGQRKVGDALRREAVAEPLFGGQFGAASSERVRLPPQGPTAPGPVYESVMGGALCAEASPGRLSVLTAEPSDSPESYQNKTEQKYADLCSK